MVKELTNDERFDAMVNMETLKELSDRIIQLSLGKLTVGDFTDYRKMDLLNKAMRADVHFTLFWSRPDVIELDEKLAEYHRLAVRNETYRYPELEELNWQRYELAVTYARERRIIE